MSFKIYDITSISIIQSVNYMIEFYILLHVCVRTFVREILEIHECKRVTAGIVKVIFDDREFP